MARIHVLAAQLKLTDDQYRAVLWTVAQVESAKDADTHQRMAIIKQLESHLPAAKRYPGRPHNADSAAFRDLHHKIEALLADAQLPWGYALGIAHRMHKKQRLELCSHEELTAIIAALSKQALKRLHGDFEREFGKGWAAWAQLVACLLFGFEPERDVSAYAQPLSQVWRWHTGALEAPVLWCEWPRHGAQG